MAITLQNMVDETADYVKAELTTTGTPAVYDEDSQVIVDRIISGLNEAKDIVAKRKYHMTYVEDVTLDADSMFSPSDLTYSFYRVVAVRYNDSEVSVLYTQGKIECDAPAASTVSVEYWYIPAALTELTDEYPFPDAVSWRALCYYATARFYQIRGGSSTAKREQKWTVWLQMWNDALNDMDDRKTSTRQVRNVYQM